MPAIGFMLGLDRLALLVARGGARAEDEAPATVVSRPTLVESLKEARDRRARGEKIRFGGPA
jgi:hypothetical protein